MASRVGEFVDPEILPRVAAAVELGGGVVLFFGRDGEYLGVSTTHVDHGFYPKGEGNAKP